MSWHDTPRWSPKDGATYWYCCVECKRPVNPDLCIHHPDAPWQTTDGERVFDGEDVT